MDHTKFAKAADKGLQAWAPATQATGTERALRQIRGIINKLTPEKFDRLLGQLVGLVTSLDVLQGTIRLLFESAIAQPTFVTVYAELCDRLSTVCVCVGGYIHLHKHTCTYTYMHIHIHAHTYHNTYYNTHTHHQHHPLPPPPHRSFQSSPHPLVRVDQSASSVCCSIHVKRNMRVLLLCDRCDIDW